MERLTDPLTTTDAKLWADEFMKVKARLGEQKFDHAMMLGWFANAIMVGYDEGSRRAKADAQATVEALQRERDRYKAVLAGAEYEQLDKIGSQPIELCQALGQLAKQRYLDLQAALDAEREKVAAWKARVVEKEAQANEISGNYQQLSASHDRLTQQLSQLQALVRRLKRDIPTSRANVEEHARLQALHHEIDATLFLPTLRKERGIN